ncbi:hypothetical protein J2S10_004298 [Neobacillus ginsengisoli]|uniref:Sporulation histidine kinase inhibitor Sda n=1 Tax=Neobacillus ginsengisoli TaxID=904295 RepID=A0ABT9XZU1_9BACI|nr:hypothetical protein [Neobacillus ginsengisoli]
MLEAESQSRFLLQFEVEDVDKTYNRFREKEIEYMMIVQSILV